MMLKKFPTDFPGPCQTGILHYKHNIQGDSTMQSHAPNEELTRELRWKKIKALRGLNRDFMETFQHVSSWECLA